MKADDYAKAARELLAAPPLRSTIFVGVPPEEDGPSDAADIAIEIARRILSEAPAIAKARHAETDGAIRSIMLELRQRWNAVCDRMNLPAFRPNLLDALMKEYAERADEKRRRKLS